MASICQDLDESGQLSLPTQYGLATASVQLRSGAGGLSLQLGSDLKLTQRRSHQREAVDWEVLIAVPDPGHGPGLGRIITGRTINVSQGGVLVNFPAPIELNHSHSPQPLDAEITLPGDRRLPTVLSVVDVRGPVLRSSFAALTEPDRHHLGDLMGRLQRAAASQTPPSALGARAQG